MRTVKVVPYPRPNYQDRELDSKEMINGTLGLGIFDDIKHFRPVFDRYNVTENKLLDISSSVGTTKLSPESFDISQTDPTINGVREMAWLPALQEEDQPDPDVIYDPRKYYNLVTYSPSNYTDLSTPYIENAVFNIPYYDNDDAGLFGVQEIKNDDHEVVRRNLLFFSLKTETIQFLANIPMSLDWGTRFYGGYVKGGLLWRFGEGASYQFLFFKRSGGVVSVNSSLSASVPFGDEGEFAIEHPDKTTVYNTNGETVTELDGLFCTVETAIIQGYSRYTFGVKIGDTFIYTKGEDSSYKWTKHKNGEWSAKVIDSPLWKYRKQVLHDYMTDGWMNIFKALHINQIRHGIYAKPTVPFTKDTKDNYAFEGSDEYGDFIRWRDSDGHKHLKHTYSFSVWSDVTDEAANGFYGAWGRIWVKGRSDGITGFLPYTISVISDSVQNKMRMLFQGFVFKKI